MEIKLIVGLANPGKQYIKTRHNVGSWYVHLLAKSFSSSLNQESKFYGNISCIHLYHSKLYLMVPTTFMNLSGKSVAEITKFYCIHPEEILVAHDDLNLAPGIAKFKIGGSHGGHNGIKDIISKLGNNSNFYRLRIGIGSPTDKNQTIHFVLNNPSLIEEGLINQAIHEAVHCTKIWMNQGFIKAMNRLHTFKIFKYINCNTFLRTSSIISI